MNKILNKEKPNYIRCRLFSVAGSVMQFRELIYLPSIPNKGTILILENEKEVVIKHVIIRYNAEKVELDLYAERNKDSTITDLIEQKNVLFPTHLGKQQ